MILLNSISRVIQAFSELLHLEIACFNPEGKLIAATEKYINHKGESAYAPFFNTLYGNHITFLHQPGKMNMCNGCHFINNCPSKAELIQDMVINGKKYGYVSFVSFSDEKILLENKEQYVKWISRLKEIIVSILCDSNELKIEEVKPKSTPNYIFGNSISFKHVQNLIKNIKNSTSSILITGETGTGKSLLAKYIHSTSVVSNGPFVELNCASIPESLFESELFGYDEGAFTNARRKGKQGYLELAHNGTLFLDEIADLPISLQPKLLKVLQDGIIQRVGGTHPKKVNFRLIVAANQSFDELMQKNLFRPDLYYRLNVIPITVPPLRERLEDLPIFVNNIIEKLYERTGKYFYSYTDAYIHALSSYHWPGNLRELENIIEYSMNMESDTVLNKQSLPPYLLNKIHNLNHYHVKQEEEPSLRTTERKLIIEKLQQYGYSYNGKQMAAKDLGISVRTLYRKMEKLHIETF